MALSCKYLKRKKRNLLEFKHEQEIYPQERANRWMQYSGRVQMARIAGDLLESQQKSVGFVYTFIT